MKPESIEHEGHQIEVRLQEGQPRLLVDGIAVHFGRLPDGKYYLHDYAYDWSDDLIALAKRYVSYQSRAREIQSKATQRGKE